MLASKGQPLFPALYLYPLNGSFVAKYIGLQDNQHIEIGRQVDAKTIVNRFNGYFDANVLSKQHAEIWEDNGKVSKFILPKNCSMVLIRDVSLGLCIWQVFIRDLDSTQGTYVNGKSIASDDIDQESTPHELNTDDVVVSKKYMQFFPLSSYSSF